MRIVLSSIVILMLLVGSSSCNSKNKSESEKTSTESLIVYANDMSTFSELINSQQPVLVDFYADWCAPCRMMAPILEQVASNMKDNVKVVKVDVDKNRKAAMKYGVQSIPTLILFQNGEVKWQGIGVMQADQIEQLVKTKAKL